MSGAREFYQDGDPLGWFEQLYRSAAGSTAGVPWADERPNPNLTAWCERTGRPAAGVRAAVVGCGLGDDAVYLAGRGAEVTAFDLAPTAVRWARRRFPDSPVRFVQADLFEPMWTEPFAFVAECYTLQALPARIRPEAMARVAALVAPGGELLVVCRGTDNGATPGEYPPWPLTPGEFRAFEEAGLRVTDFEDYFDPAEPDKRRFRVSLRRP